MKDAILQRLCAERTAGRAAVLATRLSDGAQALFVRGDPVEEGDLPPTPALLGATQEALRSDRGNTVEIDGETLFVQAYLPPLRLIIVGAVHIAQHLAPMARLAGYRVIVVDPRRSFATAERFPGIDLVCEWPDEALHGLGLDARSAVVVLTHDPKLDDPALEVAVPSDAFYIAALGSRKTHAARLQRLADLGLSPAALARVHGPAGLDINAESPSEIAISVLAQVTQSLRRRESP